MSNLVLGLFNDSLQAGHAVSTLKEKGYNDEISVLSKDNGDTKAHTVDESVSDGALGGATTGAVMGGVVAILAGATSLVLPGVGIAIAGPLAVTLTSAAVGAATGSVVGALVDKGIPDNTAKVYEDAVSRGEILVAVDTDENKTQEVAQILGSYGATNVNVKEN